jgi:hypothetical protein
MALPISPMQVLWINPVTAVTLGLSLAFESTEPATMTRPPRPRRLDAPPPGRPLHHLQPENPNTDQAAQMDALCAVSVQTRHPRRLIMRAENGSISSPRAGGGRVALAVGRGQPPLDQRAGASPMRLETGILLFRYSPVLGCALAGAGGNRRRCVDHLPAGQRPNRISSKSGLQRLAGSAARWDRRPSSSRRPEMCR